MIVANQLDDLGMAEVALHANALKAQTSGSRASLARRNQSCFLSNTLDSQDSWVVMNFPDAKGIPFHRCIRSNCGAGAKR
jgi:hypothetical protein